MERFLISLYIQSEETFRYNDTKPLKNVFFQNEMSKTLAILGTSWNVDSDLRFERIEIRNSKPMIE